MSTTTLRIIDSDLLSGSVDDFRDKFGGFYSDSEDTEVFLEPRIESYSSPTLNLIENEGIVSTNTAIHLANYSLTSRITTNDTSILNDTYWQNYVVNNFGSTDVFVDHKTSVTVPVYKNESEEADSYTSYAKSEYYKFYERYQTAVSDGRSERLIPNYYFLKSQGIADLDVAQMITLEGTLEEDYFDYVNFREELLEEQPELFVDALTAAGGFGSFFTPEEGRRRFNNVLFLTEVSDPEEGAINTLFSNVASDKGVPRYSYNNISSYLNIDYVNHTYSDTLTQRLENRLQNIIFLDPSNLDEHNSEQIATDFSFLKDDKKQSLYSLMPMSNHIRIDNEVTAKIDTPYFDTLLGELEYKTKFMKTIKEVFSNEISLTPQNLSFTLDKFEAVSAEARGVNLLEMILYNYNNYLSETTNCFFYDAPVLSQKMVFDSIGEYRFENSERSSKVLNAFLRRVNNIFEIQNRPARGVVSIKEFLRLAETDKYVETVAYKVEKIGGPPTGDSRTENVIQNFWFYNTGDLIEYVDTQVKYGTDYTYKTYAYAIVVGNKYQFSDLRVTRQIDIQETETPYGTATNYCLEFYNPLTGETTSQLLESETNLADDFDVAFGRSQDAFDTLLRRLAAGMSARFMRVLRETDIIFPSGGRRSPPPDVLEFFQQRLQAFRDRPTARTLTQLSEAYQALLLTLAEAARIAGEEAQAAVDLVRDVFGAFENVAATNAQIVSSIPYLADFRIIVEPSAQLVEIPIQEKTFKILDNPPNDLIATPYHLRDQSNRLAFFLSYDTFSPDSVKYPTTLTAQDEDNKQDYLNGIEIDEDEFIQSESISMAETFEVYRLLKRPTSYQDFEDNLRKSIDLRILKQDRIKLDAMFMERVKPNQKYYYTFRVINENGIAGEFTPVFEAELINDGGYIYGSFNQLTAEDLVTDQISEPLMSFKKLFNVVPNIQHLILDSEGVDFSDSAFSQVGNFSLGTAEDKIWNKTFKLRLTSKKTGKKIDLNIRFNNQKG